MLTWLEFNIDYRLDEMETKIQQQQIDNAKMRYLIENVHFKPFSA